ncbi:hypothetical protein [Streptococcus macacae]|uniref:Virus attachment protein p12 family protein n=1 Tax=Streptococcus macacae NCTC 11558 TaxID=764298 RepID=G5JVY1_9STRE|nr:hypothetical protein [Streptococcus macacae]EHJ53080.1 hypothetical protein STRMA_1149 [Streptococcus macacae NCTC 11558]SUN78973.1 membrane protein [Streptococcus macacae NCTC 11558]
MSTIIIAAVIIFLGFLGIHHYIKQKGSCGDCDCACPVKDEMHKSSQMKHGK